MAQNDKAVVMEDVRIVFRNFAGKEGMYNREGDRNFAVLLAEPFAQQMIQDGWNVKYLKQREEDDAPQAYLQVSVNFKGRPPRIVMITSRGRNPISEDEVELLDYVDIRNVDVILNPYSWSVNGATGIKAYLQSMFIIIEEDALELKYADTPDAAPKHSHSEEN